MIRYILLFCVMIIILSSCKQTNTPTDTGPVNPPRLPTYYLDASFDGESILIEKDDERISFIMNSESYGCDEYDFYCTNSNIWDVRDLSNEDYTEVFKFSIMRKVNSGEVDEKTLRNIILFMDKSFGNLDETKEGIRFEYRGRDGVVWASDYGVGLQGSSYINVLDLNENPNYGLYPGENNLFLIRIRFKCTLYNKYASSKPIIGIYKGKIGYFN